MKDTIVTARRKKIELITLLVCFVVSNLIHLYAIIAYHAPFTEMITCLSVKGLFLMKNIKLFVRQIHFSVCLII